MARMLRNTIGIKPNVTGEDLRRYVRARFAFAFTKKRYLPRAQLVQSILDQSHLTPLTTHIQPVLPDFDHALRLYPLPTAVSSCLVFIRLNHNVILGHSG